DRNGIEKIGNYLSLNEAQVGDAIAELLHTGFKGWEPRDGPELQDVGLAVGSPVPQRAGVIETVGPVAQSASAELQTQGPAFLLAQVERLNSSPSVKEGMRRFLLKNASALSDPSDAAAKSPLRVPFTWQVWGHPHSVNRADDIVVIVAKGSAYGGPGVDVP